MPPKMIASLTPPVFGDLLGISIILGLAVQEEILIDTRLVGG